MNEKALVCLSNRDILDEGNMALPEPELPIYMHMYADIDINRDRYRWKYIESQRCSYIERERWI